MARAKNTSRSEARRRTREQERAELAAQQEPEDGGESSAAPVALSPRPRLFKWPDIPADLRALPSMFRTKPLLWLPFILVAGGFVLVMIGNALPVSMQPWIGLYIQFFFLPQALFTYFIGGFLAPRASYLVGGLVGLAVGLSWVVVLLVLPEMQATVATTTDLISTIGVVIVESVVLGIFAGGFAGWYRDYLRGLQKRSAERQMQKEADAKARRRDERQEARRSAKAPVK